MFIINIHDFINLKIKAILPHSFFIAFWTCYVKVKE